MPRPLADVAAAFLRWSAMPRPLADVAAAYRVHPCYTRAACIETRAAAMPPAAPFELAQLIEHAARQAPQAPLRSHGQSVCVLGRASESMDSRESHHQLLPVPYCALIAPSPALVLLPCGTDCEHRTAGTAGAASQPRPIGMCAGARE